MGNCTKPQHKKKLKEQVVVVKEHFRFRQLQILNRLNPTQVSRLFAHFSANKVSPGYRLQRLRLLYTKFKDLPEVYAKNLFGMLDLTKDGVVCFTDFCVAVARASLAGEEERVKFLYDFLDVRASGHIPTEELLTAVALGALKVQPGGEQALRESGLTVSFVRFKQLAIRSFDVSASLDFCTFLPTPTQQREEVAALFESEGRPRPGQAWFLISSAWVQAWERYVHYPISLTRSQCSLSPLDESDIPTAIDNTSLCNVDEPLLLSAEKSQFAEVPQAVWNYWIELYGGGPAIPREVFRNADGQGEIDLYPCLVVCLQATDYLYDVKKARKVLVAQSRANEPLKSALASLLEVPNESVEVYTRSNKKWVKVTAETTAGSLKPFSKCLVVSVSSPITHFDTLKESKSPALTSELKTSRILSQWTEEAGAEPPRVISPEDTSAVVTLPWKGIPNMGNTCYMNCVLQCLCYTPLLGNYFINRGFALGLNTKTQKSLASAISSLFSTMTSLTEGFPDPSKVHRLLGEQSDLFQGHDENDSYECLVTLLDRLHEELKRGNTKIVLSANLSSPSPTDLKMEITNIWSELHGDFGSPVSDLFSGVTKTTVACPNCTYRTITLTPTFSLDLQMPHQNAIELIVNVLPLSGHSVAIGLVCAVSQTVEAMMKQAKAMLEIEMGEVLLVAWAYSGIYTLYGPETKLQEVVHDSSVSLYAMEIDPRDKPDREEAAPTPREATPQPPSSYRTIKLVHRFHITRDSFLVRDYFPEVVYIPERITASALLEVIADKTKRFQNPAVPIDRIHQTSFFVDFSSKMCGLCDKFDCMGCGLLASDVEVDWSKVKEKFVIWVRWDEPDSFLVSKLTHPSVSEILTRQKHGISIADCLDVYSKAESLSAHCSKCPTDLTSTIELVKLPDILIVTLCRFRMHDTVPIKVNYLVKFPLESLNMGKWVSCSEAKAGSCTTLTTPLQYVYDLYAVVDHIGNARSGTH